MRSFRAAVNRLDTYISRPRCCSSPSCDGARFCRGPLSIDFFCCRLEIMEVDPLRLVFLLLMVAIGASARWILLGSWLLAARRPRWWRLQSASCSQDAEEAAGAAVARRMDRARASPGGGCRRWRAWIHGRGSSGCGPDRCCFGVALSSSMAVTIFCGLSKPLCDGVLVGLGFGSDGQSRRCPTVVEKGTRDLVVISVFLGALSVSREGQLSSVFLYGILVCGCVFVCFLNS